VETSDKGTKSQNKPVLKTMNIFININISFVG